MAKPGYGKAKGSQFEREVCVMLSRWVSNGAQDDCFWRSAMSGGRSTVAAKKGKRLAAQGGDISCIHPIGQRFSDLFVAECKFYSDLNISGLLTGKGKLVEFWKVLCREANRLEKLPFLIAKQNRLPTFICLSNAGVGELLRGYEITTSFLLISPPLSLNIFTAETFLTKFPPP